MYYSITTILSFLATINTQLTIHPINAFSIEPSHTRRNSRRHSTHHTHLATSKTDDLTESQVNGETSSSTSLNKTNDMTETIRNEATAQYEEAMEYFMFELGNDIVFLSNQDEVSNYIQQNFDTIIFDCDGVLYRGGNNPIPECRDALTDMLSETQRKKQILFLTNNAEYSREQLCTKLTTIIGCDDGLLSKEQMITSSYSAAKYLEKTLCQENDPKSTDDCNVVVIGSNGLCDELTSFGFHVNSLSSITDTNQDSSSMDRTDLASYSFMDEESFASNDGSSSTIDAIVVGLDTNFTYRKLCIVTALLKRHPNALFVATNEDAFDVVDGTSDNDKRNLPGNGSIVKSIEVSSQRKATNVGKPSTILVELLQNEYELNYSRTLMVGDRLDTDVKFGRDGGMKTALVLTGCTTTEKLMEVGVGTDEEPLPHIIFPHMGMMLGDD